MVACIVMYERVRTHVSFKSFRIQVNRSATVGVKRQNINYKYRVCSYRPAKMEDI